MAMIQYSTLFAFSLLSALPLVAETRYFVASPLSPDWPQDAFIVPISDPEHILQAKYLAHEYPDASERISKGRLVTCFIAEGSGGINRDYGLSNSLWNWRVIELEGFFDGSILAPVEGTPVSASTQSVSEDIARYLALDEREGVGLASFNYYTITGELPFQPSAIHEDGTKESWFGTYRDDFFPWIEHAQYGQLYVSGMDPENIWFWSNDQQSWFYTRESHGNFVYRLSDGAWLFFSESSRWFYNYTTMSWEFGAL